MSMHRGFYALHELMGAVTDPSRGRKATIRISLRAAKGSEEFERIGWGHEDRLLADHAWSVSTCANASNGQVNDAVRQAFALEAKYVGTLHLMPGSPPQVRWDPAAWEWGATEAVLGAWGRPEVPPVDLDDGVDGDLIKRPPGAWLLKWAKRYLPRRPYAHIRELIMDLRLQFNEELANQEDPAGARGVLIVLWCGVLWSLLGLVMSEIRNTLTGGR